MKIANWPERQAPSNLQFSFFNLQCLPAVRCVWQREKYGEARAPAHAAFDFDAAAVLFHDPAAAKEAEAGAGVLRAVERLEDPPAVRRGNAATGIGEADAEPGPILIALHAQAATFG